FSNRGLWPFNPDIVVDPLQAKFEAQMEQNITNGGVLTVKDANRAIKKRATKEELRAEKKRLKELQNAPLGSMPPPLSASDEAALDYDEWRNMVDPFTLDRLIKD
ncbi:hypothetical protein TSTA_040880, partial [Talaromyces stipitatus ATCC 10500]